MSVFNFKTHIIIGILFGAAAVVFFQELMSKTIMFSDEHLHYYIIGLIVGSIIPDLDHPDSKINWRIILLLKYEIKLFMISIPSIILYQILKLLLINYMDPTLMVLISTVLAAVISVFVLPLEIDHRKVLIVLGCFVGLGLIGQYGFNLKSIFAAITSICVGYFPHRAYTHRWHGFTMIVLSIYLLRGLDAFFVGAVIGMISHIASDGFKSKFLTPKYE